MKEKILQKKIVDVSNAEGMLIFIGNHEVLNNAGLEIRNHLPFFSSYNISCILIIANFNTLINHSISGQILASDPNLLYLKPNMVGEEGERLEPISRPDVNPAFLYKLICFFLPFLIHYTHNFKIPKFQKHETTTDHHYT
ncbi:MAG: hypothetical protein ACTHLB_01365 [Parafilimonas sp.]